MRQARTKTPAVRETLSFDEVTNRYAFEWVLLKVTGKDDRGVITHGEVIDHTPHRAKLNRAVKRFHDEEPDAHIFIFLGGSVFGDGAKLREALRRYSERDDIDAWP